MQEHHLYLKGIVMRMNKASGGEGKQRDTKQPAKPPTKKK